MTVVPGTRLCMSIESAAMARHMEIILEKRNVRCVAELLEDKAPRTCEVVWQALPQSGDVFHAKYASNEIYALVAPFPNADVGWENRTVTPAAGDVCYFYFPTGMSRPRDAVESGIEAAFVDLAVFYDRDNLLLSPKEGFTPANVYATIVENLDGIRDAGHNIWREGFAGERLIYRRVD